MSEFYASGSLDIDETDRQRVYLFLRRRTFMFVAMGRISSAWDGF